MTESTPPAPDQAPALEPLATRIAYAMAEAGDVVKGDRNDEQGYSYASAERILAAVRAPLLTRGVILTPSITELAEETIESRRGSKGTRIIVRVRFTFTDGVDDLGFDWRGEGQDYGDKAFGKAMTNAVKTFVRTAWLLPTEHDDPERSDPGERVAAGAAPTLPPWALEASAARKAELVAGLTVLLDGDRDLAKRIGASVKGSIGHVPDVLVALVRSVLAAKADAGAREEAPLDPNAPIEEVLARSSDAELEVAAEGHPVVLVREQARAVLEQRRAERDAGEADDPPPEGAPDFDGSAEDADVAPPGSITVDEVDGEAPVDRLKRLRAAGCVCSDPVAETPTLDDSCPVVGHGIPF